MLGYTPVSYTLTLVAIVSISLYDIDIQQQLLAFKTTIGSKVIYLKNINIQPKEVRIIVSFGYEL